MFPPTNRLLYYAVSYVEGNGNEIMKGKSQKVRKINLSKQFLMFMETVSLFASKRNKGDLQKFVPRFESFVGPYAWPIASKRRRRELLCESFVGTIVSNGPEACSPGIY